MEVRDKVSDAVVVDEAEAVAVAVRVKVCVKLEVTLGVPEGVGDPVGVYSRAPHVTNSYKHTPRNAHHPSLIVMSMFVIFLTAQAFVICNSYL